MLKIYSTIVEHNDVGLVIVAGLVCVLASYTALSLAVKPAPAEKIRYPWLIASGVAVGSGGWAAYLILLLGFQPGASFAFELTPTVFALAVGIVGSCIGLLLARGTDLMPVGGAIVGFAVTASFYLGMIGIQFSALKSWDSLYVITSIVLGGSCGAAALARGHLSQDIRGRVISSAVLSFGIMGTCLIGLSGLDLTPDSNIVVPDNSLPVLLGISLTAVVMLIASLGVVGALIDRYIAEIESARSAADTANEAKMGTFRSNWPPEL
jgi:NO-binding membrane sensor protein with MHYT domain